MATEKELTGYPSIDKPWLKYYSEEAINAKMPECTIYEYLWENNKDHLDDVALIYFNRKITYKELFENIDKTAKALTFSGVKPNEIVTIAMPSIPEALYLVYAANKVGAIANMIHPLAGESEIVNYLNEVKTTHFFMFYGTYEIVKNALNRTTVKKSVVISAADSLTFPLKQLYKLKTKEKITGINLTDWTSFINQGRKTSVREYKKDCNTPAIISHTGGTTGEPKGVVLSDKSVNTVIWEIGCNLPHERQEITMVVLPPFINYSLVNAMLEPLAFGFKVVLIPKYEPEKFDEYIKKYHPNHLNTIPDYLESLLSNENLKTMDLSCLKYVFYGGEAMNPQNEEKVNELILSRGAQFKIGKGLGATELVSAVTVTYPDCNLLGSVGIPLCKANCKIIDTETGDELSYNQEGEICFSGLQLMLGYYENQIETDNIIKIHSDGERWLHTGDLGYLNDDGVLFVSGRIKRILVTKGDDGTPTKLFPARIENLIMKHPSVELCCVATLPDDVRVNVAIAFVVLVNDVEESSNLIDDLMNYCKENLPDYMLPEKIIFKESLPRTQRGKVDYRALEKEAEKL